jgi:succinate dehydrogenase/fumarate reductase flavoprotein subunit
MSSCINGKRNESSLQSASKYLSNLKSKQIKITDKSRVMNTEMATALKLQGMIELANQIVNT